MGGGGEKKKTNQMIDQDRQSNKTEHNQFMNTVNAGITGSTQRASDMYNSLSGGYNKFIEGGYNFDPSKYGDAMGSGGDGGAGGDGRFGEAEASYRNFMNNGGVDTGRFNQFQGHLMDVAGNGGFDDAARSRILGDAGQMRSTANDSAVADRFRGGGVFDEFAKTGGYSDQDIRNIRSRATSVIPAFYDVARNEANRMSAVQGGYGPGRAAMMGRMSRQQAQGAQKAALDAELGIKEGVNEGRKWGASGMSGAEASLQDMRMRALTGAAGVETGMWDAIAGNRTAAAGAGGSNETGMQDVIQKGKMFGTQGLEGMAESSAARGRASAAAAAADAKWRAEFDREGAMYGLDGMKSLYGMKPGEVDMYLGYNLAGRDLNMGGQQATYGARMQNNPQRDWLGTIAGIGGMAGGVMTGLGNLGYGRGPRS